MPRRPAWQRASCVCRRRAVLGVAAAARQRSNGADGAQPAGGSGIEEIVVTATRREESLSKVPISVSAFTEAKMDDLEVKSFADLARFTPGVTFDDSSKDISIRGIDSSAGTGTTGIYIDDTPIQIRVLGLNSNNTLPTVFDLDRVEILRGPQGTLFGAGSEGGTVRYITPQPSLTDYHRQGARRSGPDRRTARPAMNSAPHSAVRSSTASWDSASAPGIAATAAGSIASIIRPIRSTTPNANETDTYVYRGALTWQPTANLKITPSIDYQNRQQHDIDDYWVALSNPGSGKFTERHAGHGCRTTTISISAR